MLSYEGVKESWKSRTISTRTTSSISCAIVVLNRFFSSTTHHQKSTYCSSISSTSNDVEHNFFWFIDTITRNEKTSFHVSIPIKWVKQENSHLNFLLSFEWRFLMLWCCAFWSISCSVFQDVISLLPFYSFDVLCNIRFLDPYFIGTVGAK